MKIYTRKGDKGKTSLFTSQKEVSKGEPIISVLGTIDEANSHLGLAASQIKEDFPHSKILKNKIFQVQNNLFKLGAILAGAKMSISKSVVKKYEREIDEWTKVLPKRKNFILPGGSVVASEMFICRALSRRLEREVVILFQTRKIKPNILVFLNRLSDYLYVLARYINFIEKVEEVIWKK
jgi:cob(I)alamin adenosyltransferase